MDAHVFLRGLVIGLSIAAPVGPIGVLCIRRTLSQGRMVGLATGLGAATADAVYGGIAGFGITIVAGVLLGDQTWIRLIGGFFLCYLGVKTALASPAGRAAVATGSTLITAYGSALALTLTNPLTILSFAAIFAGLGAGTTRRTSVMAALLVLGVFAGSALWWLILSSGVALARQAIGTRTLHWINRCSGGILLAFGLVALAGAL